MKLFSNTPKETLDDMIFEDRNKSYGAYDLRTTYGNRVGKSALLSIVLFVSLVLAVSRHFSNDPVVVPGDPGDDEYLDLSSIPEIQKSEPLLVEASMPFVKPREDVYIPVEKVPEEKKEEKKEERKEENTGEGKTNTFNIAKGGGETGQGGTSGEGKAGAGGNMNVNGMRPDSIRSWVPVMPEFIGGEAALKRYIRMNFHIPADLQDDVKVKVGFTVNEDGSLSDIKVIREAGNTVNQEVIRVIAGMPAWKPGNDGGYPVKVHYELPIKIRLQ
jgi:protein TonB